MSAAPSATGAERRRLRVRGVVQGVGFRPFVHRLAEREHLGGFVLNDGTGVVIEAEGPADALDRPAAAIVSEAPPLARVDAVVAETLAPLGSLGFRIDASAPGSRGAAAAIPPDVATCDDCLRELFDPLD